MTKVIALEPIAVPTSVETTASTNQKKLDGTSLIHIVLDETGSMSKVKKQTISAFNEFINSQKNGVNECRVNLNTFSTTYDVQPNIRKVVTNQLVNDVIGLNDTNYQPNGGTNLYDAIGEGINEVRAILNGKTEIPSVMFVIVTDGEENQSREFDSETVKNMIKDSEAEGWTFVYLGANQNAFAVGKQFGLDAGQTMTYSVNNMDAMSKGLTAATTRYRSASLSASGAEASIQSVARGFFNADEQDVSNV